MYQDFFQLSEPPFSIVPNPKFYYLSERHKEALRYVLRGIEDGGGLALLTGEVGTGKTTTLKQLLERLPKASQVISILNPSITVMELMTTLCNELGIEYTENDSFKYFYDVIANKLFDNDEKNIKTILLVDEAQHISPEVLEQLRLLTNIETTQRKLLKVILVGQPELQQMLRQPSLRQLAQRITARYHLIPLPTSDVKNYILHRLNCTGRLEALFSDSAMNAIAIESTGVPRLINLICDQALKIAFLESKQRVSRTIALKACHDVLDWQGRAQVSTRRNYMVTAAVASAVLIAVVIAVRLTLPFLPDSKTLLSFVPSFSSLTNGISGMTNSFFSSDEPSASLEDTALQTVSLLDLAEDNRDYDLAIQRLYRQWGFEQELTKMSCSPVVRDDLACHRINLSLPSLLAMRRPAVLKFLDSHNQYWYGTLLGGSDGLFELQVENKRVLVDESFMENAWSNEAYILWRPPFENLSAIKIGDSGERVFWVNNRIDEASGSKQTIFTQFDSTLKQKVQEFQYQKGLNADGIPGAMTFIMLDSVQVMTGPTLIATTDVSPAQQRIMDDGQVVLLADDTISPEVAPSLLNDVALPVLNDVDMPVLNDVDQPLLTEVDPPFPSELEEQNELSDPNQEWVLSGKPETTLSERNQEKEFVFSLEKKASEEEKNAAFALQDLDLSTLSPELALKVKAAFTPDDPNKPKKVPAPEPGPKSKSNVTPIATLSDEVKGRLPALDFQMHIYTSNSASRWVRVNGEDVKKNQLIARGVRLVGIQPQQVVVEFERRLISIPALSRW